LYTNILIIYSPLVGVANRIYDLQPKEFENAENVIECENVSKIFSLVGREEKIHALNNICLKNGEEFYPIKRGEFVMIRGPSGGGKTTLLN
jgi:putative ABC transport system ATP-binding protein